MGILIGDIIARLNEPRHRVDYAIRSRGISGRRLGRYRVFTEEDVAKVKEALAQTAQRAPLPSAS